MRDTLYAYRLAKRCSEKRVLYEAVRWGERGPRSNSISPGIIVTPLVLDEFNGPRGGPCKHMFAKCPAERPGTADEERCAQLYRNLFSRRGGVFGGDMHAWRLQQDLKAEGHGSVWMLVESRVSTY